LDYGLVTINFRRSGYTPKSVSWDFALEARLNIMSNALGPAYTINMTTGRKWAGKWFLIVKT
jgi:hypothetical protein